MKPTKKLFNKYYYHDKLSFKKMSDKTGISVGTLHRHFHKLHLKPRTEKVAWNKGKNCFNDSRILSGEKHPRWKNSSKYLIAFKIKRKEIIGKKTKCVKCGKVATILHHINKNTYNNEYTNLMPLCASCHTILHNKERGITIYRHDCEWCGKEFTILHNKQCKQRFCSQKCASLHTHHIKKTALTKN